MKKIVITGATGKIGSALLPILLQEGVEVIALVRKPEKVESRQNLSVFKADLENQNSYKSILKGIDAAFLLTPALPSMDSLQMDFIEACKESDVPFLLKLSAMGADELPDVNIFKLHHKIENMLISSGLHYAIIRPNAFSQNILIHGNSIYQQGTMYAPSGEGGASYVDVRDVALAAAKILLNPISHLESIYNLTGPQALSGAELAELIASIINKEVSFIGLSPEQSKEAMLNFGLDPWLASDLTAISVNIAQGKQKRVSQDFEKITGKSPRLVEELIRENTALFTDPPKNSW